MTLTKRPLFFWILNRFRGLQLLLLLVITVSLFFRIYPLEMQRKIINVAINLKMIDKLYLYCALYMGSVLIAGIMKYFVNTLQAIIGEKILIDLRNELYRHLLQLPLTFFHKTQTGTIISGMTAELNAISSFLGGALAVPITSLFTFVTFMGFMIYLNPLLGLLSMGIYPVEMMVIPLLQKRFNAYNRKRVATTRQIASLVNESVTGIHEVQGNAGFVLEQKKLDILARKLFTIVTRLSIYKYGIKFSNNLFQSFGPFLLFLIGGYLAIHGDFTIGALVAFLSAYEKVYDPWKETLDYFQSYQDAQIRYKQIMTLFDHEPEFLLEPPSREPIQALGNIAARNLSYQVNEHIILINNASFQLNAGKHLALVGFSGSGKSTLSLLISQLFKQTSGSLTLDGYEISSLSKLDIARNISSVAQNPFIFTGTVRDNLLYACNTLLYNNLIDKLPDRQEIINIIKEVGLAEDVIRWGLRSVIPPERLKPLIARFLKMRTIIHDQYQKEFSEAVEFYDINTFLNYSSIAINIIFGSIGDARTTEDLLAQKEFRTFLKDIELEEPLTELGFRIGSSTVDFLEDFQEDDFFFQGSPMEPEQFENYKNLVQRVRKSSLTELPQKDRDRFLFLALEFTPGIHKIVTLTPAFENDILDARTVFLTQVAKVDLDQCIAGTYQPTIKPFADQQNDARIIARFIPFCTSQYLPFHSLRDNILFGSVSDQDLLRERLAYIAIKEFEQNGLLDDVIDIGLDFHVGSKGDNLSGGQKQKLALARALLKKSPLLILDEATASLDNSSQARIQRYIEKHLHNNTTVVAVVHRLDMISGYDHIIVMKDGKIVESDSYANLMNNHGILYDLVNDSR